MSGYLADSLTKEMMEDKELAKDLDQNGDGINQYMQSLKEISQKFKEVTRLSASECLTWLEFEKEKNELEVKMLKQKSK